ncbi:PH domain-containing protein [Candidatus Parcubacteria bacterium]|jgi:membrane protein YdbS with pleckstrin-like domain|nr:PH domain-containing protein [Candidatus Parcubacteria bacterium]MBT3949000.1 PH domain-containing protein [Candidatus Parcubacteria bacterium]
MKDLKLKEGERIVDEVRQYGLTTMWSWIGGFLLLAIAAFFMFWLFRHDWWGQSLFALLILGSLFVFFRTYFLWKKNVFFITTHRLIDIEQGGFFHRVVSEIPYDQVEDVSGKVKGMFGTLFRYGNVRVQTGNGKIKIIVPNVKRPLQLQQQINEMRERYLSKYSHEFSGDVAEIIVDKLYELELPDLRQVQKALDKRIKKLNIEE